MSKINDITTLNTTISDLISNIDFNTTLFDNKMKSATANNVFNDFEKAINKLYEKTRLLSDLRQYTLNYITNEYNNKYSIFTSLLKTIEESSEEYQNNDVIAHNIEFNDSILIQSQNMLYISVTLLVLKLLKSNEVRLRQL